MPKPVRLLLRVVSLGGLAAFVAYELQSWLAGERHPGFRFVSFVIFIGVAGVWQLTATPAEMEQAAPLGDVTWRTYMISWYAAGLLGLGYFVYWLAQGSPGNALVGLFGAALGLGAGALHTVWLSRRRQSSVREQ